MRLYFKVMRERCSVSSYTISQTRSSTHGTAYTDQKQWGYALALPPQSSNIAYGSLLEACWSTAPEMQMSLDNSYKERASLESPYSFSSAHDTAYIGPHTMGLHACLAASTFKHRIWVSPVSLLEP